MKRREAGTANKCCVRKKLSWGGKNVCKSKPVVDQRRRDRQEPRRWWWDSWHRVRLQHGPDHGFSGPREWQDGRDLGRLPGPPAHLMLERSQSTYPARKDKVILSPMI